MDINKSHERTFNHLVLRGFGVGLLFMAGIAGAAWVFWQIRGIIPFGWSVSLFFMAVLAWLFGANAVINEVIPDLTQTLQEAKDEELLRVMANNPPGSELHELANTIVVRRRGNDSNTPGTMN